MVAFGGKIFDLDPNCNVPPVPLTPHLQSQYYISNLADTLFQAFYISACTYPLS